MCRHVHTGGERVVKAEGVPNGEHLLPNAQLPGLPQPGRPQRLFWRAYP
jgi:hypothetical protein